VLLSASENSDKFLKHGFIKKFKKVRKS